MFYSVYFSRLTATKVIQNLCYLLSFHATNADHTNHCLAKIIFRIAFKLKLAPLFYQISVFNTFQEILSSPSSRYKVSRAKYEHGGCALDVFPPGKLSGYPFIYAHGNLLLMCALCTYTHEQCVYTVLCTFSA